MKKITKILFILSSLILLIFLFSAKKRETNINLIILNEEALEETNTKIGQLNNYNYYDDDIIKCPFDFTAKGLIYMNYYFNDSKCKKITFTRKNDTYFTILFNNGNISVEENKIIDLSIIFNSNDTFSYDLDRILLNDGKIELKVDAVFDDKIETTVVRGDEIWSRRGFNLPDTDVDNDNNYYQEFYLDKNYEMNLDELKDYINYEYDYISIDNINDTSYEIHTYIKNDNLFTRKTIYVKGKLK